MKIRGFTLIELMITIAIVAILAAIALPSYDRFVKRTRRADGHELMMRIAAAEERFYTNRNTYSDDIATDLGLSDTSEKGHYVVAAALGAGGQTYVLTATPQNNQSTDKCANLTINNVGFKDWSGDDSNGKCW